MIVLNGASSSGKSTLAKELQLYTKEIYLHCTLDMFWNMTPANVRANSINFPHLKCAMAQSVIALASTGHNVIVDIVLGSSKPDVEFVHALSKINYTMIKIDCALEELERREIERGNRKIGLAKSQFDIVHRDILYDMEIDTTVNSPKTCAQMIVDKSPKVSYLDDLALD